MKYLYLLFYIIVNFCLTANQTEQTGIASWYGKDFHGKITANGEIFNTNDWTAAHRTYPFGSIVKVISLENNKSTIVRINDRGPFKDNRIIDLSMAAANDIDMLITGTMNVKIILLEKGDNKYHRYSEQKYILQIITYADLNKANDFIETFKDSITDLKMQKVNLDKIYYRIYIDDLNYSELQLYRIKLHKLNINNYLIKLKK